MDEARLIRFVVGPEQRLTPDIGRKLPGRGLWVAATREAVDAAARKGLFARAAKARVETTADVSDQVEHLLLKRLLATLGLARRAGELVLGFEKVGATLRQGAAAWWIEAVDGAADGRRKLAAQVRSGASQPQRAALFSREEMSLALGAENVIHAALLHGRNAARWAEDVERLAGFRPTFPTTWGEEPFSGPVELQPGPFDV